MRAAVLALQLALAAGGAGDPAAPQPIRIQASFLFALSRATGAMEATWASLAYDRTHDEAFVVQKGIVEIFNSVGMQTHTFGGDVDLNVTAVAVLESGDLVALASYEDRRKVILRLNFRGERVGPFELKGLPAGIAPFAPDVVLHHEGRLYFVEQSSMRVVVTEPDGTVAKTYDLAALMKLDAKARREGGLAGFGVAPDGSLLFTMPTMFKAMVVTPTGQVRGFGTRGSTPGKFNIVGGIAADERGTLFVTDRLRCVVMAFDRDFAFLGEFGYRGEEEGNLVAPFDIAAGRGKIYVSQAGNRGVSVFKYGWE